MHSKMVRLNKQCSHSLPFLCQFLDNMPILPTKTAINEHNTRQIWITEQVIWTAIHILYLEQGYILSTLTKFVVPAGGNKSNMINGNKKDKPCLMGDTVATTYPTILLWGIAETEA